MSDTPSQRTPVLAGKQMSASLRERLKRAGRSYTSPCIKKLRHGDTENTGSFIDDKVLKSISADQNTHAEPNKNAHDRDIEMTSCNLAVDKDQITPENLTGSPTESSLIPAEKTHTLESMPKTVSKPFTSVEIISNSPDRKKLTELSAKRNELKHRIAMKEDKLNRLKLVKVHKSKNDLCKLEILIQKWRSASQQAIQDLWQLTNTEPRPTLTQLVDHLQLDHTMVGYNPEEETFN